MLGDVIASQYRISLKEAMFYFPLHLALKMWPAVAQRMGWEVPVESDPKVMAAVRGQAAMKKHLEAHYTIIDQAEQSEQTDLTPEPA